jgi:hypothetical protein
MASKTRESHFTGRSAGGWPGIGNDFALRTLGKGHFIRKAFDGKQQTTRVGLVWAARLDGYFTNCGGRSQKKGRQFEKRGRTAVPAVPRGLLPGADVLGIFPFSFLFSFCFGFRSRSRFGSRFRFRFRFRFGSQDQIQNKGWPMLRHRVGHPAEQAGRLCSPWWRRLWGWPWDRLRIAGPDSTESTLHFLRTF